jgi:hypothetical protein
VHDVDDDAAAVDHHTAAVDLDRDLRAVLVAKDDLARFARRLRR